MITVPYFGEEISSECKYTDLFWKAKMLDFQRWMNRDSVACVVIPQYIWKSLLQFLRVSVLIKALLIILRKVSNM